MANIKISDLTAASAAADANEFEINEAGTSKKVTGAQISALVETNLGLGALATLSAVGTTQITDGSVTNAKLGADAVDGTKIADDAIDSEHIAADSIDAEHYAPDSVDATALNVSGNGTSGQALTSDGDGTFSWADVGGGYTLIKTSHFSQSGTWNRNGSANLIIAAAIGGGGGGATEYATQNFVCGGGGGGIGVGVFTAAQSGNSQAVTVGSFGYAFGNSNSSRYNGNGGGQSKWGNLVIGNGGGGGTTNKGNPGNGSVSGASYSWTGTGGYGGRNGSNPTNGNGGAAGGHGSSGYNTDPDSKGHSHSPWFPHECGYGGKGVRVGNTAGNLYISQSSTRGGKGGVVVYEYTN